MNNNRTNRRRGRGNRNQGGGGQQLNRIDSRARGNAPQLLEKYKKLAQDAQHNGDRVQAEYCLQRQTRLAVTGLRLIIRPSKAPTS